MRTTNERFGDDRGAVLVHAAFALLAIFALSAFVLDYGVLWASRRQAQNAADSGALAGAMAIALDGATDYSDTGPVKQGAYAMSQQNNVWGQPPSVTVANDIQVLCPTCADGVCPDGSAATCVRVDVYRDPAHSNPLPTFFGQMIGITQQGVKATATAEVVTANASKCLKPWAIQDKWFEVNAPPWTTNSIFEPPSGDWYQAPTATSDGSSYTIATDYGLPLTLKMGSPSQSYVPGWFAPVDLGGTGGDVYRDNISGCAVGTYTIGQTVPVENGNMIGPTKQGVNDLIAQDPDAYWDPDAPSGVTGRPGVIKGSKYAAGSPRIVAVPMFNTQDWYDNGRSGKTTVTISNILGFFIDKMDGNDVVGYLVTKPDLFVSGVGGSGGPGSFVKSVILIR